MNTQEDLCNLIKNTVETQLSFINLTFGEHNELQTRKLKSCWRPIVEDHYIELFKKVVADEIVLEMLMATQFEIYKNSSKNDFDADVIITNPDIAEIHYSDFDKVGLIGTHSFLEMRKKNNKILIANVLINNKIYLLKNDAITYYTKNLIEIEGDCINHDYKIEVNPEKVFVIKDVNETKN